MYTVELEDEGYEWLIPRLEATLSKIMKDPGKYDLPSALAVEGLVESFSKASHTETEDEREKAEEAKPEKKPRKKRKSKASTASATPMKNSCPDHQGYGAKRRPRTSCEGCWSMYKFYNPDKYDSARRAFDRKNT